MVDYQDYAYKNNSHGFYGTYVPFASGSCQNTWAGSGGSCTSLYRHKMESARYIKPGLQYMGGVAVNNLHRPSTVVLNTTSKIDNPGALE